MLKQSLIHVRKKILKIETYKERRWLYVRKRILQRDKYLDQYLKRYGKMKNADLVHHIFPVDDFPEYQWEDWNLISLSRETHNQMHDRTTDKLTPKGQELLVRTAIKNNIEIPYWYLEVEEKKGIKYDRRY